MRLGGLMTTLLGRVNGHNCSTAAAEVAAGARPAKIFVFDWRQAPFPSVFPKVRTSSFGMQRELLSLTRFDLHPSAAASSMPESADSFPHAFFFSVISTRPVPATDI
jgi:hypothetical protein